MGHLIRSEIALTKTGIHFKIAKKKQEINFRSIIWAYIRKKEEGARYSRLLIKHITADTRGDLVIVDDTRKMHLFLEEELNQPAGKLLIEMTRYCNTFFVGYNKFYRELYHNNFEEMKRACDLWREI